MADAPRLTSADYVVIHAVGFLCSRVATGDDWEQMALDLLSKAAPKVSPGHPMMEGFARIAADFIASGGSGGNSLWVSARDEGLRALERFHQARMAEAWGVFKGKGKANG